MPTFIKTGFWEKVVKGYKGWLDLDNLINNISPNPTGKSIDLDSYGSDYYITNFGVYNITANASGYGVYIPDPALFAGRSLTIVVTGFDGVNYLGPHSVYNNGSAVVVTGVGAGKIATIYSDGSRWSFKS